MTMDFEENQVPEAILDKLTKVCTCRSISRKTIKEAILEGEIHNNYDEAFQLMLKKGEELGLKRVN